MQSNELYVFLSIQLNVGDTVHIDVSTRPVSDKKIAKFECRCVHSIDVLNLTNFVEHTKSK